MLLSEAVRITPLPVLLACCVLIYVQPANSQVKTDKNAAITAKIVEARAYTESYVMISKQSFADKPAELEQAQKSYALAYSKYSGWASYIKTALHDGKSKKLIQDPEYQTRAADATSAGNAFTAFVDSKIGGSKAATAILSSLGALGLQLWNGIKDRQLKERDAAASNFAQDTQWYPWEAINGQPHASPKSIPVQDAGVPKSSSKSQPTSKSSSPQKL